MQGHIWTETVRTADQLQEMVFPRLIALAERAWHRSAWEDEENKQQRVVKTNEEWTSFAKTLVNKELDRLEGMGIKYNIAKPGGRQVFSSSLHPSPPPPPLSFSLIFSQSFSLSLFFSFSQLIINFVASCSRIYLP